MKQLNWIFKNGQFKKTMILWPDKDYCEKNPIISIDNHYHLDVDQTELMLMGYSPAEIEIGPKNASGVSLVVCAQPIEGFKLHKLPTNEFKVPYKFLVNVVVENTLHPVTQAVFCPELPDFLNFMRQYAPIVQTIMDCYEARERRLRP